MEQQSQQQQSQQQRGRRNNNYGGHGGRFNHNNHSHHHSHHNYSHHSHSRGGSRSEYYSTPSSSRGNGNNGSIASDIHNNNYMNQQIAMLHQRVVSLEERNRNCAEELEYFRHLAQQLTQSVALQQQEFAAEKEVIIAKAKAETMAQLITLSGNPNMWNDPFLTTDPKLKLETAEYMNHHPLLSSATYHAWVSDSTSPCLQPMPTFGGNGIMSDLRDRYEDVKCLGYLERYEKTEWIMKMIRKIVMHYEKNNMRVYEEALSNQYVSTLIWCPNDSLCPQKSQSSFSFGYGPTQLAATESALQHAFNIILEMEEKSKLGIDNNNNQSSKALLTHKLKSPIIDKTEVDEIEPKEAEVDEVNPELFNSPEEKDN